MYRLCICVYVCARLFAVFVVIKRCVHFNAFNVFLISENWCRRSTETNKKRWQLRSHIYRKPTKNKSYCCYISYCYYALWWHPVVSVTCCAARLCEIRSERRAFIENSESFCNTPFYTRASRLQNSVVACGRSQAPTQTIT